jgi:hypothetical protein
MRARPWQLAVVVAACGAAVLVAGRATGSGAGGGPDRTVVVTMHHSRFRFVLRNTDPIDHEFILGDGATQRRHERGRDRHHHGEVPGERSVPAGQDAATTYTFPAGAAGQVLEFACHLPGHYAYGMRGTVRVSGG